MARWTVKGDVVFVSSFINHYQLVNEALERRRYGILEECNRYTFNTVYDKHNVGMTRKHNSISQLSRLRFKDVKKHKTNMAKIYTALIVCLVFLTIGCSGCPDGFKEKNGIFEKLCVRELKPQNSEVDKCLKDGNLIIAPEFPKRLCVLVPAKGQGGAPNLRKFSSGGFL
ncbi:hypothetical protein ScPMuIL_018180 [Solemya velum]